MRIGILALQGAVEPHAEKLRELGAETVEVRRAQHLENLEGIILPGGESTTMLHLLERNELWAPLREFLQKRPGWGVCAGSILMAEKVTHPEQRSLAVLPIEVERNAFGRQIDSFIAPLNPENAMPEQEGVFIRAPRIRALNHKVQVLYRFEGEPVMVEFQHSLASTFHPELSQGTQLHEYFLKKCGALLHG